VNANLAASIRARLLNLAKERGEDFSLTLNRYAIERYLYRLAQSPWRDKFLLKGALLFDLWFGEPHRPTRDADFLGFGSGDTKALAATVAEVCSIPAADGIEFDVASITIAEIREDARYGGLRVRLTGILDTARCSVQLDVGYGDAVTPGPDEADYPTLLSDLPAPRLRVYPRATVVAEKLEAIVSLGMANSRMKDFFDIRALAREGKTDPAILAEAIAATFARRGTPLPSDTPLGLSDDFARDAAKLAQWKAFLGRNRLAAPDLREVIEEVRGFVAEPLRLARKGR
jgi:predicted nucleotidyltransferase component of viral defense system